MKGKLTLLLLVLLLKAIFLSLYILYGHLGLGPDEAQYWTWSKQLDWGYYSKPPGIAWQIFLGTALFGDTEFGVRFGSLLIGTLIPVVIFCLAIRAGLDEDIAFWSALAMAFSPLGFLSTLFAITDVGLVLAWCLAAYPLLKDRPNFILSGFFVAIGALYKWPAYLFWAVVLLGMARYKSWRRPAFAAGVLISLLGLAPALIWNIQNNWATFKHVGTTIAGGHGTELGTTGLVRGNLLEFIGAQALLLSPILFVLLVIAWINLLKRKKMPDLVYWGALSSFVLVLGYSAAAIFQKMQGNWCVFAYPLAMPAIAWTSIIWTKRGIILSILLTSAALTIPYALKEGWIDTKANPFKHNLGWRGVAPLLENEGYDDRKDFLFGETYQMTSLLSFYGPGQKRAYFFNLEGVRHNQFDFWPTMKDEQTGKDGYFVQSFTKPVEKPCDPLKEEQLKKYFKEVKCLGVFQTEHGFNKYIRVWKCENYNGESPSNIEKY